MPTLDHHPNLFQRGIKRLVAWGPMPAILAPTLHRLDKPVIRLTGGNRSLTSLLTGLPVATLTAIGAKSGQPRSVPLLAIPDGANFVLIASSFGRPQHPGWYYNVRANPEVTLTIGPFSGKYHAQEASGVERARLWQIAVERYAGYADYERRAQPRQIPIIHLTPIDSTVGAG